MEETNNRPLLDSLVDSKELQILKTMIPYMHQSQQKQLAMIIRFIELMKTTELFEQSENAYAQELKACSVESDTERLSKMLSAVKVFCSEQEKERIDMLLNVMEMSASCDGLL